MTGAASLGAAASSIAEAEGAAWHRWIKRYAKLSFWSPSTSFWRAMVFLSALPISPYIIYPTLTMSCYWFRFKPMY